MSQRTIYIDAESILNLLTHYSEGDLPLDAKLLTVGVSSVMGRWIGMLIDSDQWRDWRQSERTTDGGLRPLHIRYEGKKVLVWGDKPAGDNAPAWRDDVEAPKRTS